MIDGKIVVQGSATFQRVRTKQQRRVIEEGKVIKYVDVFFVSLKQKQGSIFYFNIQTTCFIYLLWHKPGVGNLLKSETANQQCSVMEEGDVIKYVNKFSGSLKQNVEFNIILFLKAPYFTSGVLTATIKINKKKLFFLFHDWNNRKLRPLSNKEKKMPCLKRNTVRNGKRFNKPLVSSDYAITSRHQVKY